MDARAAIGLRIHAHVAVADGDRQRRQFGAEVRQLRLAAERGLRARAGQRDVAGELAGRLDDVRRQQFHPGQLVGVQCDIPVQGRIGIPTGVDMRVDAAVAVQDRAEFASTAADRTSRRAPGGRRRRRSRRERSLFFMPPSAEVTCALPRQPLPTDAPAPRLRSRRAAATAGRPRVRAGTARPASAASRRHRVDAAARPVGGRAQGAAAAGGQAGTAQRAVAAIPMELRRLLQPPLAPRADRVATMASVPCQVLPRLPALPVSATCRCRRALRPPAAALRPRRVRPAAGCRRAMPACNPWHAVRAGRCPRATAAGLSRLNVSAR